MCKPTTTQSSTTTSSVPSTSSPPRARYTRQFPSGNHVWVNTERLTASLRPLRRSTLLEQMARDHAKDMAEAAQVLERRQSTTNEEPPATNIQGNNLVGPSIQLVHQLAMTMDGPPKDNILNPEFKEFGMAAVKGSDNNLYICQLFC